MRELLARGHSVRSLALRPAPPQLDFPSEVELSLGDLSATPDEALRRDAPGH